MQRVKEVESDGEEVGLVVLGFTSISGATSRMRVSGVKYR